ncbi:MAG: response regulator transcription factor [Thermodesulfobacteriota bacterium]
MRILVIEDDQETAAFIKSGFKRSGYAVDHAADGEKGLELILSYPYDAVVIDIMLPKLDGLTILKRFRNQNIYTPVLILSAKSSVDDRVRGLGLGSDDYLAKPYSFIELLARVRSLIRRTSFTSNPTRLIKGDLTLDLLTREVTYASDNIELLPKEFSLLEYLMRHHGEVVSKNMILEHLWSYDFEPQTNVVEVMVCRLRNKLEKNPEKKIIQTIRGAGYVLKVA